MTLTLRYAARSDRGLIRDGNQDSVYAGPRLLAVADGMGGMAAGDLASNIVIGAMAPLDEDVPGDALVDALRGAVEVANQHLRDTVDANPHLEGMGTTLTAMLFSGTKIGLVHIGDSRAYMLRDNEFAQITKDDTYVQMLVDEGRISAEEATGHPQRSLLTRAMDGRDIEPEYSVRQVIVGDRYLICSDGLSGVVSSETIGETLREYVDPSQCVERLIALALRGGGPDNITVIIADATNDDIMEDSPVVGGAAARDRGMTQQASVESTPATRAATLTAGPRTPAPPAAPSADETDRPKRHTLRTLTLLVILVALLSGGLWYGWHLTQSQYYVGVTSDGYVAVFKGVPGQLAGVSLSSSYQVSTLRAEELTPVAQERVRKGIQADTAKDAMVILTGLTSSDAANTNLLPICQVSPSPSASPSAALPGTPSPSPSVSASPTPGSDVIVSPAPCRS
ncbi:protein phosphatase [Allocatelliglobosispora scoriae]|uniref:Serine/threonine protein phosphatase PstP n=1 Tax=Allocatelliglobosispora scoriae TaxID=643052 RepID=A0A841BTP0_9ACTN|nr:BofC C-terminal domain-containing protein [Allocatelliglobosispora scoriae]MBB5871065.1 protein phosphatase [Allocatelliglobosispora scoriae]